MRRQINILVFCLFVLGMVVMPAAHMRALGRDDNCSCSHGCGHGQQEPARHDADQCPICQLAHMPFNAIAPVVAPTPVAVATETAVILAEAPIFRLVDLLPFSCGPPA